MSGGKDGSRTVPPPNQTRTGQARHSARGRHSHGRPALHRNFLRRTHFRGNFRPYVGAPIRHASRHPACDAQYQRGLLRDRGPAVPAADPAHAVQHDHGLGLRFGQPPGHVQLPFIHDRGHRQCAPPSEMDQPTGRRQRQLPPAPARRRPDHPLGQPARRRGGQGQSRHRPARYTGPVPMVPHVHGAHVNDDSDGYAEAWLLPNAKNIPAGYATAAPTRIRSPGWWTRRAPRRSSIETTSEPRRSGITTTRWA